VGFKLSEKTKIKLKRNKKGKKVFQYQKVKMFQNPNRFRCTHPLFLRYYSRAYCKS